MVVTAHPERPVAGIHQLGGGMHNGAQGGVELESRCDRQDGVDQTIQPVAAFDDLFNPVLDFQQQLATEAATVSRAMAGCQG